MKVSTIENLDTPKLIRQYTPLSPEMRSSLTPIRASSPQKHLLPRVVPAHKLVAERLVLPGVDGVADVVHQADHELQVVHGAQRPRQELLGLEQVVDVGARVVLGCLLYTSPSPRD